MVRPLTSKLFNLGKPVSSPVKLDKSSAHPVQRFREFNETVRYAMGSTVPGVQLMLRKHRLL